MNLEALKNRMKARSFEFDADDGINRPPYVLLSDVLFEIEKLKQTKATKVAKKLNNELLADVSGLLANCPNCGQELQLEMNK